MDGGGHRHDVELRGFQVFGVVGEGDVPVEEAVRGDLLRGIFPSLHHVHTPLVDVKTHDPEMFGKGQCNGQSDIAQSHHRHGGFFGFQAFEQWGHSKIN